MLVHADLRQTGVVVVAPTEGVGERRRGTVGRSLGETIAEQHAHAVARRGHPRHEGMLVALHLRHHLGQSVVAHIVQIHHADTGKSHEVSHGVATLTAGARRDGSRGSLPPLGTLYVVLHHAVAVAVRVVLHLTVLAHEAVHFIPTDLLRHTVAQMTEKRGVLHKIVSLFFCHK